MRVLVGVMALLVAVTPVAADDTVAGDAFRRAEELVTANPPRWAEACPLFEASYRADPQIGVLLHLANCYEQVGRFASAWVAFKDAADLARDRKDTRETLARDRASALVPKLSKVKLVAPAVAIPGLAVTRDGKDITVLVGSEIAVDPGDREFTASAPGYKPWTHKLPVSAPGVTTLQIPALEKAPDVTAVRDGTLVIKTPQPGAEIYIDSQRVGTGTYTGLVKRGGHTLRVVAPGMRTYQVEVLVGEGETRTIDVPLESAFIPEPTASFELAASLAPGVKLKNDNPAVLALRVEAALRLGRRVNFGLYAEYARISTSGTCGTSFAGPEPSTPFDFGPRGQFTNCSYLLPGLQLFVHVLPRSKIDPYIGISPGFRFGTIRRNQVFDGMTMPVEDDFFPAIMLPVRAGVTYHPSKAVKHWTLGGYVETSIQLIGDTESATSDSASTGIITVFTGFRSTVVF